MRIENENGYITYSIDDMNDEELVIDNIEVIEKRKGTGTKLVQQVIEIANKQNKKLTLCAYPQNNSITLSQLVNFYEKLGFNTEYDTGSAVLMYIE